MSANLTFRNDGTFTIVQFTDMHIGDGKDEEKEWDTKTNELVIRVVETERPDLIVLTGDMIWSEGVRDPAASFRRAIAPVTATGIPWAAVFGNHDAEGDVTKEELLAIAQESAACLAQSGPTELSGVGNYVLTVKAASGVHEAAALYFLDSGMTAPESVGGYEWIHADQINWYIGQSRLLRETSGGPLPALAFFHIPLPEYAEVWQKGTVKGHKFENIECAKINSGLFAAMVEMGDVMGVFVGHDHDNDYCGTLHGIELCFGRISGFNCYGKLKRGARVIRLKEGNRHFDTWIRQYDGEVVL
ncbi:metallophosphoesterase family protein [Paenibacillus tarimensis]